MLTAEWRKAIEGYLAHERAGGKRTSTSSARTTRRYVAGNPTRTRAAIEALAAAPESLPPSENHDTLRPSARRMS